MIKRTQTASLIFSMTFLLLALACGEGTALPASPELATISETVPALEPTATPQESIATEEQDDETEQAPVVATGLRIAYIREGNLWLWRGSSAQQMTDIGDLSTVRFSTDGQMLAFQRGTDIWIARSDGTEARQLFSGVNETNRLWFAPNGTLLAVASNDHIDVVELSTGNVTTALTFPAIIEGYIPEVVWTPDALGFKTVIPPQKEGGQAEFFFVFTTGTAASLAKFVMVPPMESAPFLSPDGGYLIYVAKKDGQESLYLMDSSGATKPYGEAAETVRAYGWLPDSKRFAYQAGNPALTFLGEVSGQPTEISLEEYESLRWVDTEHFLGLKDDSLYLGLTNGEWVSVDAGVTDFDFVP